MRVAGAITANAADRQCYQSIMRKLDNFKGVAIMTPRQFLERLSFSGGSIA